MATRKVIRGVLENFLGTYVSRYSEFDGYWLFGFLVENLRELSINLLEQGVNDPATPLGVAVSSAFTKFEAQRIKAGLAPAQVRNAWLTIRRLSGLVNGSVNCHTCVGFKLSFSAVAVMDDGTRYERERVLFVAPHDSHIELRSARVA